MSETNKNLIELYIEKNLPINYDLDNITSKIADLLDNDKVVYYIPGSKMASQVLFTRKKVIIVQNDSPQS